MEPPPLLEQYKNWNKTYRYLQETPPLGPRRVGYGRRLLPNEPPALGLGLGVLGKWKRTAGARKIKKRKKGPSSNLKPKNEQQPGLVF